MNGSGSCSRQDATAPAQAPRPRGTGRARHVWRAGPCSRAAAAALRFRALCVLSIRTTSHPGKPIRAFFSWSRARSLSVAPLLPPPGASVDARWAQDLIGVWTCCCCTHHITLKQAPFLPPTPPEARVRVAATLQPPPPLPLCCPVRQPPCTQLQPRLNPYSTKHYFSTPTFFGRKDFMPLLVAAVMGKLPQC